MPLRTLPDADYLPALYHQNAGIWWYPADPIGMLLPQNIHRKQPFMASSGTPLECLLVTQRDSNPCFRR